MADQTETPSPTPPADGQAPAGGGDDIEARINALLSKRLEEVVEARLAPFTGKYNKEFAGLRKRLDAMGQAPSASTEGEGGQAPPKPAAVERLSDEEIEDLRDQRADLLAKLPESLRAKTRERFREQKVSLRDQIARLGDMVDAHTEFAAAHKTDEQVREKPGRDARSTGNARGHSPASRSPEPGLPNTYREWMALPAEKRDEILISRDDFDPRTLPMR